MGKTMVVVGGQFGSEGKGAIAGYLGSRDERPLAAVRVAGPNAGHSALDKDNVKWALRHIPVVAVTNPTCQLVIGAGSEIDEEVLESEIERLENAGIPVKDRLWIDGEATVIESTDKSEEEELVAGIGSTGKGIGSARARRAMRSAPLWRHGHDEIDGRPARWPDTAEILNKFLQEGGDVLIEGTQGYGLGLHAGHYPKCTSSDCRAIDFLAMAGVSPWSPWVSQLEVWVVLRTYPIRVAGPSGEMHEEVSWDELGRITNGYIRPEKTTVTQKVRRVGKWDKDLAATAVRANGGQAAHIALTFFDYWFPELAGVTDWRDLEQHHRDQIAGIEDQVGARVGLVGTGPGSVIDLRWRS